jgi:acyl-CoA thioester hydrolase
MLKPIQFNTSHRAKFSQIDPYGVMHNQYFLEYFMDHRMTGLRENFGWDLQGLQKLPILFIVRSVNINFLRPVKGDSPFVIESRVESISGVNCEIFCQMRTPEGKALADCRMTVVSVDAKTLKSCDWPAEIQQRFYEPAGASPL